MQLIIASDLVPRKSNEHLFNEGDINTLLGKDLSDYWFSADFRIFNLEVPLTDTESPISKCGPNLVAPTSTVKGIKGLKPSVVTLANNHILDQGINGLESTEELLISNGIPFVGTGRNTNLASKPYILEKDNLKIGIYACTENEFTVATSNSAGANPFDPLESLDHILELKSKCDYVVVLYHGGKEHYRYPSPYLQKVCRKMTEKGADLVICQHSHCIGCYENYGNSKIIYGQGNFIFDKSKNEMWNTSVLVNVRLEDTLEVEYIPIIKKDNVVRLAKGTDANEILDKLYKRSNEITDSSFIEMRYQEFANEKLEGYIRTFAGFNKWVSRIDRRLLNNFLLNRLFNADKFLAMQNFIECEAHRELVLKGIKGVTERGRKNI
ncbi:CapA family protein [Priestia megaterium]|uniref:CapA family protein n=1 Tax=Priestia megaterium TaxID=1404 RepID=UPI003F7E30CD